MPSANPEITNGNSSPTWPLAYFGHNGDRPARSIALFLLVLVLNTQSVAGQADYTSEDRLARVVIVLEPPQLGLVGSNMLGAEQSLSPIPLMGAIFALAESRLDSTELVRSGHDIIEPFDFGVAVRSSLDRLDDDANWQLVRTVIYTHPKVKKRAAHRMLAETGADYVFYLEYIYFISPGLDQIRLRAELQAYEQPTAQSAQMAAFEKGYEFLSQSRGAILRPFHAGEKEAMIEAIENQYERKLAKFPHNKKAYRQDRKKALNAIKDRDTIFPLMAVDEGWPGKTFPGTLQLATDNLLKMMQQDLLDIHLKTPEEATYTTFSGLDLQGKEHEFNAYAIGRQGMNTVYRDEQGNFYSVP